jgi:hypothetical protein
MLLPNNLLISQVNQGLVKGGEYSIGTPYAIHHDSGPLPTPKGNIQAILPIIKDETSPWKASLGGDLARAESTSLDATQGLLLNQDTSLLPESPIDYILIRFRI